MLRLKNEDGWNITIGPFFVKVVKTQSALCRLFLGVVWLVELGIQVIPDAVDSNYYTILQCPFSGTVQTSGQKIDATFLEFLAASAGARIVSSHGLEISLEGPTLYRTVLAKSDEIGVLNFRDDLYPSVCSRVQAGSSDVLQIGLQETREVLLAGDIHAEIGNAT